MIVLPEQVVYACFMYTSSNRNWFLATQRYGAKQLYIYVGSKKNDDDDNDNDKVFEEGTLVTFFILSLFFCCLEVLKFFSLSLLPIKHSEIS